MEMLRTAVRSPALPVVLLTVVLGLDGIADSRRWRLLIAGLLDEPAHLATAVLVLIAVAGPVWLARHRSFTIAACTASVAIDLDHVPLYAGIPHIAVDGGRPFTHSLATVAVLLVAAIARPARAVAAGLAAGVALHLFRDLASGPGVSALWPLDLQGLHISYGVYAGLLVLATVAGTVRSLRARRSTAVPDRSVAADMDASAATAAE